MKGIEQEKTCLSAGLYFNCGLEFVCFGCGRFLGNQLGIHEPCADTYAFSYARPEQFLLLKQRLPNKQQPRNNSPKACWTTLQECCNLTFVLMRAFVFMFISLFVCLFWSIQITACFQGITVFALYELLDDSANTRRLQRKPGLYNILQFSGTERWR